MVLLILGLLIFFASHLGVRATGSREALIERFGLIGYRAAHSVFGIIALALIVIGYQQASGPDLWYPLEKGRSIAHALMPFAVILVLSAVIPSNLRRYLRFPVAWGIVLWALSHLANRGNLESVLLFGAMLIYALATMILTAQQEPWSKPPARRAFRDVILIGAGFVAYVLAVFAHDWLGGPYLIG
ncbi:MAG: NnrU family protein [Neomegalonema sp.]|nr:NnrU family protein [Neomegalonema sp.]